MALRRCANDVSRASAGGASGSVTFGWQASRACSVRGFVTPYFARDCGAASAELRINARSGSFHGFGRGESDCSCGDSSRAQWFRPESAGTTGLPGVWRVARNALFGAGGTQAEQVATTRG